MRLWLPAGRILRPLGERNRGLKTPPLVGRGMREAGPCRKQSDVGGSSLELVPVGPSHAVCVDSSCRPRFCDHDCWGRAVVGTGEATAGFSRGSLKTVAKNSLA